MLALLAETTPRVRLPPQLQSAEAHRALAGAIAATIWTYDGLPYRELWVQGSCNEGGTLRCGVTVSGLPGFASSRNTEDTNMFEVASGTVTPLSLPQLRGYPASLDSELDTLTRSLDQENRLEGLALLGVEWMLAPPDDAYVLRYGTASEEGSPSVVVTVDRTGQQLLGIQGAT